MKIKEIALSVLLLLAIVSAKADTFWLGADVGGTSALEHMGVKLYNKAGVERDNITIMKELGMNACRLRVWVNPHGGFCSPEDVAAMAERITSQGMALMIDFHYSDWWADPGKQNIPAAWKEMTCDEMCFALAEHTRSTLQLLKNRNIDVKWVQIGNETTNGMLWPVGNAHDNMAQYAALTRAGYNAAKEVYPNTVCIVHIDCGSDINRYRFILNGLKANGATWDMIGMSVYPYWDLKENLTSSEDETLEKVIKNINILYHEYGTPLMIVETGYDAMCPNQGKLFMTRLIDCARHNTGDACRGVLYWAPEAEAGQGYPLGAFANHRPTIILDPFNAALWQ